MSNHKTVRVEHRVTVDSNVVRGVTYTGLSDPGEVKRKLQRDFPLAPALQFPLYKWFLEPQGPLVDFYYYEPPGDIAARKAATLDSGLGNLLLSHLPGWSLLPDRETSAKVYSHKGTAHDFSKKQEEEGYHHGRMFRAVPVLQARLVIAPAAHLRYSFPYALGELGVSDSDYGSLGKLNGCCHELLHACGMTGGVPSDWQLFLTVLQDIAFERVLLARHLSADTEALRGRLIKNKDRVLDFLDQAFSPLNNGFSVVEYNDGLKEGDFPDNEIWMASPCLFIEEGVLLSMQGVD